MFLSLPRPGIGSLLVLVAGCAFDPTGIPRASDDGGLQGQDAALPVDGGALADASSVDTGVPAFPYEPSNFDPDGLEPAGDLVLDCGESAFDSETLSFTDWCSGALVPVPVDEGDLVILPVDDLVLAAGATLRLRGNRPVVLAVFGDATIEGMIDASASADEPGPGGSLVSVCEGTGTGEAGVTANLSGGGGGGGGFGTAGASGGQGNGSGSSGGGGGEAAESDLSPLRGGCGGGRGAPSEENGENGDEDGEAEEDGDDGRFGGGGGGGVQLSAAGELLLEGTIAAAGGGGMPGERREGGGGGGSGGGILIEGHTVNLGAGGRLTANGGGGGGGGGSGGGEIGDRGEDGTRDTDEAAEGGDGGDSSAGDGGAGGAGTVAPVPGESATGGNLQSNRRGGGGGGGAVGIIRIHAHAACSFLVGSLVSPPATGEAAGGDLGVCSGD